MGQVYEQAQTEAIHRLNKALELARGQGTDRLEGIALVGEVSVRNIYQKGKA